MLALGAGCSDSDDPGADAAGQTADAAVTADATTSDAPAADSSPPDAGPAADVLHTDVGFDAAPAQPKVVVHVAALGDGKPGDGTQANPYRDLADALAKAPSGALVRVAAGDYVAKPVPYADPTCGNCADSDFLSGAKATRGFLVDKPLHIVGAGAGKTRLVTGAGYGVLFDGAGSATLSDLTVTGGKRDADGHATDAGIVVRDTALVIQRVHVIENDDRYSGPLPDPIVGVGGIFGREGAKLTIVDSVVEDNSWDGIALYRGAPAGSSGSPAPTARVLRTRIGCTSQCVSKRGRGAGIGVTWGAKLVAIGNVVHHYWKGIGSFGTSRVELYNNLVRDQHGWGIVASGNSTMIARNNVVLRSGTTGLAAWSASTSGEFVNNIVVGNGVAKSEWVGKKTGVWFNAAASRFKLAYNLVSGNTPFDVCRGGTPDKTPCTALPYVGVSGNTDAKPGFVSADDLHLAPSSSARNAGDPALRDLDGTRSDIGLYGGPHAPATLP